MTTKKIKRRSVVRLSPTRKSKLLGKQDEKIKAEKAWHRAQNALRKFRPRKSDAGKLILITSTGKRDAASKGKPGYMVKIGRTGSKKIVLDKEEKFPKVKKLTSHKLSIRTKADMQRTQKFYRQKVKEASGKHQKPITMLAESEKEKRPTFGSDSTAINKMAKTLHRVLEKNKSHRRFIIDANIVIKGVGKTINIKVPIDKPDHISIDKGGIHNFVKQKFYAFLSKQLAYHGFVTAGSANHVRKLKENEDKEPEEWTLHGEAWKGSNLEVIDIEAMEWNIERY